MNCVIMFLECIGPCKPEDMNVFMEPLIDELKNLFEEDILCYNIVAKETFNLMVVMLWTIHDWLVKLTSVHVHRVQRSAKNVDTKVEQDVRGKNSVLHISK